MEHKSIEQLHDAASVEIEPHRLSERGDRLRRWADVLDREGSRRFPTLHQLEFAPRSERPGLRVDGSAISVALADPLLRASGLRGDTYGDALDYFDLSERQGHRLLCSCLNGPAVEGHRLAGKLRAMAAQRDAWSGLVRALRQWMTPLLGSAPRGASTS